MANIRKIYEDAAMTNQVYPQTHERAVVDDNGTTAETKFGLLFEAYDSLTQSDIVVVADHTTVVSPVANTIYREQGITTYSDWMYYDSEWKKMAEYENAIDDAPTVGSNNLVKSGGVYNSLQEMAQFVDQRTLLGKVFKFSDIESTHNKYYYTHGLSIGSSAPTAVNITGDAYIVKFKTKKGAKYTVSSRSTASGDYGRPVVFTENDLIVAIAASNNAITTPFVYTMQNDGYIYINLAATYINDFYIKEETLATIFDDVPTDKSINAVKSGGIYDSLQGISNTIDQRTFLNKTYQFSDVAFVHNKYYATHGKGVGSTPPVLANTTSDGYCVQFPAKRGVKYIVASRSGGSGDYDRAVTFTENDLIVYITEYHDVITTPATYTMQADGYIYINLLGTYISSFYIIESTAVSDVDDSPTANSNKLVKSGGVYSSLQNLSDSIYQRTQLTTVYTKDDLSITTGCFYNTHNKSVGSSAPFFNYSTEQAYAVKMSVQAGATYTVSARSTASADYARPAVFCENNIIVAIATYNNAVETPFTYTMQNDGDLYISFNETYLEQLSVVESIPLSDAVNNFSEKKTFPMVFMPKKLYGVVGEKQQLFYRGIVRKWNPYQYFLRINASGFKSTPRYTQVTPSSVGTTTVTCNIIDDDYDISPNVTSTLITKEAPSSSDAINVLCLGASTVVNPHCFPVELERRLCQTGGTPTGLGLSNISFVGRKTVLYSSTHCEATGGWTWSRFVTAGTQTIHFYLTGADTGYINAVYSFVSSSGTVQVKLIEWNVTAGTGNALFEYVTSSDAGKYPTSQSGTLTYISGGENTPPNLSFTDHVVEAANPFWNTSTDSLDIQMYADTYCNGTIDVLITQLDTFNSMVVGDSSIDTIVGYMKTFVDAYHTDFPNGKVIIASSCPPSAYYGVEYNYGGTSVANSWSILFNHFKWAKACDDLCNNDEYSSFCYYANTFGEIDTEYAFPTEQRAVNTRISDVTETIGTNGVHPTATGSKMEADAIYRCFVCNILN